MRRIPSRGPGSAAGQLCPGSGHSLRPMPCHSRVLTPNRSRRLRQPAGKQMCARPQLRRPDVQSGHAGSGRCFPGTCGQHGVAWDGSRTWQLLKRQDAAVRPCGSCRSRSQLMHRHVQLTAWQHVSQSATVWYQSHYSLVSDECLRTCIGPMSSPGNQGHCDHAMIDAAIPGHWRSADLLWQRFPT